MNRKEQVIVEAPAKVNIFLRVTGSRSDGYHDIETLMQKIDLCDTLSLRKSSKGLTLNCPGSNLPCGSGNLAFRAAKAFMKAASINEGVQITLAKKIPIAAGLGGGSSDAAAVLSGLNQLFDICFDEKKLMAMAAGLGADVPFFVSRFGAAYATGIGDCLSKSNPLDNYWIVLVNPGFAVSTKWVYQNFALTLQGNPYILAREEKAAKKIYLPSSDKSISLYNDLEAVTIKRYPEVGEIKQNFYAMGAMGSLMSGSGPTVFGLFENRAGATGCANKFKSRYGEAVFLTKSYAVA